MGVPDPISHAIPITPSALQKKLTPTHDTGVAALFSILIILPVALIEFGLNHTDIVHAVVADILFVVA
jgi:hypothetical protein